MLKKPSEILQKRTKREYAIDIYKRLLVTADSNQDDLSLPQTSLFNACFHREKDSVLCCENIQNRIKASVIQDNEEKEFFLHLPPLFLSSNSNTIVFLKDTNIILFLCESGPVIPVIHLKNQESLRGQNTLLSNIIQLYAAYSQHDYINRDNLHHFLNL